MPGSATRQTRYPSADQPSTHCYDCRLRHTAPNQRPVVPARHRQDDRDNHLEHLPSEIDDCGSPEMHGTLQQPGVNVAQAANPNRQRHALSHLNYGRVVIEKRQQPDRSLANARVRIVPMPRLIQKRLLARESVISSRCMINSVNPFSPKLRSRRLNVVTIVTIPKSAGVSSRARMTTDPICNSEVTRRTSNGCPGATNCGPAKSLACGDRVEGAVGLKRFQLFSRVAMLVRFTVVGSTRLRQDISLARHF